MTQSPDGGYHSRGPVVPTNIAAFPPALALPTSGMAVASLVLGIIGVVGGWCTFAVPCILATVFGYVGMKHTRGGARGGRGMAIAGLVLGLIPLGIIALILILGGIGVLMAPVSSVSSKLSEKTTAPQGGGAVIPLDAVTINLADG